MDLLLFSFSNADCCAWKSITQSLCSLFDHMAAKSSEMILKKNQLSSNYNRIKKGKEKHLFHSFLVLCDFFMLF